MADERGNNVPGAPAQVPGLPSNFHPITWQVFNGVNTRPARPAVKDEECAWMDGWIPIAPDDARVLPDVGDAIYTAPSGMTINYCNFYNIGDVPYAFVVLSNGSCQQVATTSPFTVTQIAAAGTIQAPSTIVSGWTVLGFSQWGSQYVIFSKDTTNGYWLWDGQSLFTAGTLGPVVEIVNSGKNYTGTAGVNIRTTGTGSGANIDLKTINDTISQGFVTRPGSGFGKNDFTVAYITGGGSDSQALGSLDIGAAGSGGVDTCVVVDGGKGYTFKAVAVFTGGGGSGAAAVLTILNGTITAVTMTAQGTGYTSAPTLTVTDFGYGSGSSAVAGGTGFSGQCTIALGQVIGITPITGGTNYLSPPTVTIIGDGTGATAIARIASDGVLANFIMQHNGSGYTKGFAICEGGNNACNIRISQMPYGLSGTAIEIYQNQVWLANGGAQGDEHSTPILPPKSRVIFSAPSDPGNFDPTKGAGAFRGTNSTLRVGYHSLKQTNGFLYLIGDSSVDYISGVRTTTTNIAGTTVPGFPTTTFNKQTSDPQIGSSWPSSVQIHDRKVVFANELGIFATAGGAAQKVSLPLDGIYNTDVIGGVNADHSSAVADIFGLQIFMLLLPVADPITGAHVSKLLLWDGQRWCTSQQSVPLTYIATQEQNTLLKAWGTDGTRLFPLFQRAGTGFTKTIQSKLYAAPGYWLTKVGQHLTSVFKINVADGNAITITIDNEAGPGTGNASHSFTPSATGLVVRGPVPMGQNGRMLGLTITTRTADVELLSMLVTATVQSANQ